MIKIFSPTDKSFTSNGDAVIVPLKAKIHKEDNSDFYLDFECAVRYSEYLDENNIIIAPTPQGDQAFRISNPTKTGHKIKIKAWHVYYDAKNYLIEDTNVVRKDGDGAFNQINNATNPPSEFNVDSDISEIGSFRPVRKSLYESIELMRDVYGGHLVRDNFHLSLNRDIGVDNGVVIQYRKNLKELTSETNWDDVVTVLMPVGKDGILLDFVDSSASKYLVADVQYPVPFTKAVSFEQDIDKDDYESESAYNQALVDDLRMQGQKYLDEHKYPAVNYSLKANLDKITDIGDIIEVKDERIGVDIMTSVISYEYDCLQKRYTQIEFGNFKPTLSKLVPNITNNVDQRVYQQITNSFTYITDQQIDDIVTS